MYCATNHWQPIEEEIKVQKWDEDDHEVDNDHDDRKGIDNDDGDDDGYDDDDDDNDYNDYNDNDNINNDDMFIRVQPAASSLMSPQSSMPSQTWTESKYF